MDFIYTSIIDRFADNADVFADNNIGIIKHFDLFKNQYVYPELHLPYKRPALFYQYQVNWKSRGGALIQEGAVQIRLHIELENYGQSFGHSANRDYALEIFKYHTVVYALCQGFSTAKFTPLNRISNEPDETPAQTNVHIITFETKILDDTAQQLIDSGKIKQPLDDMTTTEKPLPVQEETESKYVI
ncbi:MAG: hypothetical protein CMJ19_02720 [Phycisphaeraceae bacterium]|nr:hypothetical protein [Phycisphaeraceae bacterium]